MAWLNIWLCILRLVHAAVAGNFARLAFFLKGTRDYLPAERRLMATSRKKPSRWSQRVTRESNALDLEPGVFTKANPKDIARSLQKSAERSKRRKTDAFRSAMSMLVFYINRAGKNLPARRRQTLDRAKGELRALYGRH